MKELTDLCPMPFGVHRTKPMQEVPASYLHWLWTQGKKFDRHCPVACYIRKNLESLKKEHTDGVWE